MKGNEASASLRNAPSDLGGKAAQEREKAPGGPQRGAPVIAIGEGIGETVPTGHRFDPKPVPSKEKADEGIDVEGRLPLGEKEQGGTAGTKGKVVPDLGAVKADDAVAEPRGATDPGDGGPRAVAQDVDPAVTPPEIGQDGDGPIGGGPEADPSREMPVGLLLPLVGDGPSPLEQVGGDRLPSVPLQKTLQGKDVLVEAIDLVKE